MSLRRSVPTALALVPALLAGCITTTDRPRNALSAAPAGEWAMPTPAFEREIKSQAARLPYLQHTEDFADAVTWLAGAGEAAYPTLLELAADDNPKVACVALAAMGQTGDSRLVPHIRALPWPPESQTKLRYERARCLTKLGDWSYIGFLVQGLRDDDLLARSLCIKALFEATRQTFEYKPKDEVGVREASVQRWETWLHERELDDMLLPE